MFISFRFVYFFSFLRHFCEKTFQISFFIFFVFQIQFFVSNYNFIEFYIFFYLFFEKMSKRTIFFNAATSSRSAKKQKSEKTIQRSFSTRQFFDDFQRIELNLSVMNDDFVREIFWRFFFFLQFALRRLIEFFTSLIC